MIHDHHQPMIIIVIVISTVSWYYHHRTCCNVPFLVGAWIDGWKGNMVEGGIVVTSSSLSIIIGLTLMIIIIIQ
jgi:ABC-type proline/glycine betaine transport system permease subunit